MHKSYYTLIHQKSEGDCFSIKTLPENMDDLHRWKIYDGVSVKQFFPENAKVYIDKSQDGRENMMGIIASGDFLIGSNDFKKILEQFCDDIEIEFLPFTIFNHKDEMITSDYYYINPIGSFDCVNEELISKGREMILDHQKITSAPHFFRIKNHTHMFVISEDLVRILIDAKLGNIFVNELEIK